MVKERLEEFYENHLDLEYREHWTERVINFIADAFAIGMNTQWVVAKLENCKNDEIHKQVICRCRDKLEFWQTDESDKETIREIMKNHKRMLYEILSQDIYNYCVR